LAKTPEWLLDLAAIRASKTLNEDGQLVTATDAFGKVPGLRRTLSGWDDDAPGCGMWPRVPLDRSRALHRPRFHDHPCRGEKKRRHAVRPRPGAEAVSVARAFQPVIPLAAETNPDKPTGWKARATATK
jgi:hypothetical protein